MAEDWNRRASDHRPIPDPTSLTTDALRREVNVLKELMELRFDAMEALDEETHTGIRRDLASHCQRMNEREDSQEKAVNAALSAQEKAVLKAEDLATARSISQNEWRATVSDLIASTLQRPEYDSAHSALSEKINTQSSRLDRIEGTGMGKQQSWGIIIAVVIASGSIFGVIMLVIEMVTSR